MIPFDLCHKATMVRAIALNILLLSNIAGEGSLPHVHRRNARHKERINQDSNNPARGPIMMPGLSLKSELPTAETTGEKCRGNRATRGL